MLWLAYFVLAYVAVAIQIGMGGVLHWGSATPSIVLPIVVFLAINARRQEALLGCFLLGLLHDLFSHQPIGIYAFAYGMSALFIVGNQPAAKDNPLTHFGMTLFAALVVNFLLWIGDWSYPLLHQVADSDAAGSAPPFMPVFTSALLTAAIAPLLMLPLCRFKRLFGFKSGRPSFAAHRTA